jgi:YbbR domain-containing protein
LSSRFLSSLRSRIPDRASRIYMVLSALLAIFLWTWTASEAKVMSELEVPVDFANTPEGMVVVGPDAHRTVLAQIRGPREMVKRVRVADLEVRVNLAMAGQGPQVVEIPRQSVRIPSTLELIKVFPPILHISLEKLVSTTIAVRPNFSGRPRGDMMVIGWSIDPPEALVKGPQGSVRKIGHLDTQAVSLDGRKEDFIEVVTPVSPDPDVAVVPGPAWTLKAHLGERTARRTVEEVPVTVANARGRAVAEPSSVQVSVEGPATLVASLVPSDFRCEADAQGLSTSETPYQLKPAVRILKKDPSGRLEITAVSPHFLSVRLGSKK